MVLKICKAEKCLTWYFQGTVRLRTPREVREGRGVARGQPSDPGEESQKHLDGPSSVGRPWQSG